jgi:hypothetical protein
MQGGKILPILYCWRNGTGGTLADTPSPVKMQVRTGESDLWQFFGTEFQL